MEDFYESVDDGVVREGRLELGPGSNCYERSRRSSVSDIISGPQRKLPITPLILGGRVWVYRIGPGLTPKLR
jgi:hypothetical protein